MFVTDGDLEHINPCLEYEGSVDTLKPLGTIWKYGGYMAFFISQFIEMRIVVLKSEESPELYTYLHCLMVCAIEKRPRDQFSKVVPTAWQVSLNCQLINKSLVSRQCQTVPDRVSDITG